ncbi:hypothetical protein EDD85DRAFT_735995, partial [Armillaria nabsnona]
NMAKAVWAMLKAFGLTDRIMAFIMDNATNNDTMVKHIEDLCWEQSISFSAKESRLRCMPHTIHLATLKLLEGIRAIRKVNGTKMAGQSAYQDSATLSVDCSLDDEAVAQDDEEKDTEDSNCDLS